MNGEPRASQRNGQQADRQRPHDRSQRVGGVQATDHDSVVATSTGHGGNRQWEAGPPQARGRQQGRQGPHHVETHPGCQRQVVVILTPPVGQHLHDHVAGKRNRGRQQQLIDREGQAGRTDPANQACPGGAAQRQTCQKDPQDQRKCVDRRSKQQRQQAGPNDLRTQCGQARQANHDRHRDVPPQGPRHSGTRCILVAKYTVCFGVIGDLVSDRECDGCHQQVETNRNGRGGGRVVDPQQIQARREAPNDRTQRVG